MQEQTPYIGQLRSIAENIAAVEQRHNEVVDVYADITSRRHEVHEEITAHLDVLKRDFLVMRKAIDLRFARVKQATLILSLLAQQEEVTPVRNRIDKQPYELYATTEWFKNQLLREQQ